VQSKVRSDLHLFEASRTLLADCASSAAGTDRSRSLALSTKHPVAVRRASRVYEPFRASNEVLGS